VSPNWRLHNKPLTRWRRRFGGSWEPTTALDGIIPTAEVDKHWTDDRANIYGMFTQAASDGVNIPCVALQAGPKQVQVHRISWYLESTNTAQLKFAWRVHLFTPRPDYNPFDFSLDGAWYAWLSSVAGPFTVGGAVRPDAFGLNGRATAHQTISLGGPPFVTFGPIQHSAYCPFLPGDYAWVPASHDGVFWNFQDPPLFVQPWQLLVLQACSIWPVNKTINANWYFSEREDEGIYG
jgi:hypothetical protein